MYASGLKPRDRGGAIAAVIAIHAALALAFLNMSGAMSPSEEQPDLQVFDVEEIEPPLPVEVQPQEERAPEEEGEASPPNIRSQATPVVAPEPRVRLPIPSPVVVSPTPNEGADPSQGAAEVPGPGTGAGGVGTGTGSGGAGSGTAGGGGVAGGPRVLRPLTGRDYPDAVWRLWPRGGSVFAAIRVHPDGRVTDCRIDRSSGVPVIDQWTCRLLETVARFQPAVDSQGRPITSWYGYRQDDTGRLLRR